jgi:LysM repeat protein
VNRNRFIPSRLVIGLLLTLLLVACERPVPRDDTPEQPDPIEPTNVPIVIPTAVPTAIPLEPETPQDGEGTDQTSPDTGESAEDGSNVPDAPDTPDETTGVPTSHVVQSGDTLSQIAETYDIDFDDLASANGIVDVDQLDVGQVLVIPSGGAEETEPSVPATPAEPAEGEEIIHTVVAGENMFRISLVYGLTVDELASYNGISDPARLEIGQILRIPPQN